MGGDRPELRLVSPAMVTFETYSGLVRHLRGRDLTEAEVEELRREWEAARAPAAEEGGGGS
jgi:hypothetical protein